MHGRRGRGEPRHPRVIVTLTPVGGSYQSTVAYPELGCSGTWTLVGATGDSYDFEEVIYRGSRCVERVEIRVTAESADRLRYSTELPWAATATLRRGSLKSGDPEEVTAAMGWPTEAQDATNALMVWFGAASATGNLS